MGYRSTTFSLVSMGALTVACATMPSANAPSEAPANYVNTFIGTDGTGHTFPGPVAPFGMIQPGPDNQRTGWAYTSGYQYHDPQILGFSQTRISGAGIPELGDVLILPFTGLEDPLSGATYHKPTETARPGYYAVTLAEDDIRVELTASQKVAFHRYTFPASAREAGGPVRVLVDLEHGLKFGERDRVVSSTSEVGDETVSGTVVSSNWVDREMHFIVEFDAPIAGYEELPRLEGEGAAKYVLEFDLPETDDVLMLKAAVSTVSIDGAAGNLATRPGWNFDAVALETFNAWNTLLSRIDIDADPRTKTLFYSALYRVLIHPSDIADADGRVRGPKGDVIDAPGGVYYSTFSLWDTFRASHPVFTIVAPERVDGFVASMLAHHDQQGFLPLWTAFGRETYTMIGNPALPVISDAAIKGFDGFDYARALDAMVISSTEAHYNSEWDIYDQYGYYPSDLIEIEAVSKTLEAGIGDAAVAQLAAQLGEDAIAARFGERAQSYRLIFDDETGHMRGKDANGDWREPFDPLLATSPLNNPGDYTEANAWQYLWTPALHDADGLVALLGGKAAFTEKLDTFFTIKGYGEAKFLGQEALIGQYAHGNEPSHHVAWLYAYSDTPERTAPLVADIATRFYDDTPGGIIGNDDAGQMSAWYVLAQLGFYPVNPMSGEYVVSAPMVDGARLNLPGRGSVDLIARLTDARGGASTGVITHTALVGAP